MGTCVIIVVSFALCFSSFRFGGWLLKEVYKYDEGSDEYFFTAAALSLFPSVLLMITFLAIMN